MKKNLSIAVILILMVKLAAQDDFNIKSTTIGGYGELHYNYSKTGNATSKAELDFHRFVLFFGHQWNDKWSLKAEVELEHNYVQGEKFGELELEQAVVEYNYKDYLGFRGGVMLASAGLINETHEPPTFLTVERPDYHNKIIPTTWFGNGVGVFGRYKGFDYVLNIMEGLNPDKISVSKAIRDARMKGFRPNAKGMLINTRISYTGISGLRLGGSYSYNNAISNTNNNRITILEFHAKYESNNIILTGEYGVISYSKGDLQRSEGFYVDLGYNIGGLLKTDFKVIPFISFTDYNTASETLSGGDSEKANHNTKWIAGLAVKPIDEVVIKLDYAINKTELNNVETKLFNFGIGYMF